MGQRICLRGVRHGEKVGPIRIRVGAKACSRIGHQPAPVGAEGNLAARGPELPHAGGRGPLPDSDLPRVPVSGARRPSGRLPVGLNETSRMLFRACKGGVRGSPVKKSQMRAVRSAAAVSRDWPSGLNWTSVTGPECRKGGITGRPDRRRGPTPHRCRCRPTRLPSSGLWRPIRAEGGEGDSSPVLQGGSPAGPRRRRRPERSRAGRWTGPVPV